MFEFDGLVAKVAKLIITIDENENAWQHLLAIASVDYKRDMQARLDMFKQDIETIEKSLAPTKRRSSLFRRSATLDASLNAQIAKLASDVEKNIQLRELQEKERPKLAKAIAAATQHGTDKLSVENNVFSPAPNVVWKSLKF